MLSSKWLLLLILTSCSHNTTYVEPELIKYVDQYTIAKGWQLEYAIDIRFDRLDSPMVGQCYYSNSGNRQIRIDKDYWLTANDLYRTYLIFHELGHCDLNRVHDDKIDSKGYPVSIMYPSPFNLGDRYNYYVNELFNR